MWHIATFHPVSLVSLKLATATSTGGKSVLLPTPFAVKMALLNVVIQDSGLESGKAIWESLRDAQVAVRGPDWISVNNTFTKILKPMKDKPSFDPETGLTRSMIKTIGFREYVQWRGDLRIALQLRTEQPPHWMRWFTLVNYLGKRGGFIQASGEYCETETLDADFVSLSQPAQGFLLNGTMQIMDDCSSSLTFEHVDIYSEKKVERVYRHVAIPYRMVSSSRSYSLYQRLG